MAVAMYHPESDQTVDMPEEAVPHYRMAGWLLLSEHMENQAAAAARAAEQQPAKPATAKSTDGGSK